MLTRALLSLCACLALAASASRADTVLFSDDFNSGSLDATKWTALVSSGCSLAVSSNVLHAYFTGAGTPQWAYAESTTINLPASWTSITLSGQWAYVTKVFGEMVIELWRDGDMSQFVQAAYKTYLGDAFRASDSKGDLIQSARSVPASLADFELTITPSGWTFKEDRGSGWEQLANFSTDLMSGAASVRFEIGGWEYSYTALQEVQYDNIQLTPEPASLSLLALCGLTMLRRRRR